MKLIIESRLKKRHDYAIMFWTGVLLFVITNQYFGWNKTAQSEAEKVFGLISLPLVLHLISLALVLLGWFGMLARSFIEEVFEDTTHSIKENI